MIQASTLQRTFKIRLKTQATAFFIDVEQRQYLITAAHIVSGIADPGQVEIAQGGVWSTVNTRLVGMRNAPADVAVLTLDRPVGSSDVMEASDTGLALGQDVYFLGFPYGLESEWGSDAGEFPLPLVKKATFSGFKCGEDGRMRKLFLDGMNNPGFSGGPIVFVSRMSGASPRMKVAGVVSGYRHDWAPVLEEDNPLPTKYRARYNSGIIEADSIDIAMQLIRANPIGVPVRASTTPQAPPSPQT